MSASSAQILTQVLKRAVNKVAESLAGRFVTNTARNTMKGAVDWAELSKLNVSRRKRSMAREGRYGHMAKEKQCNRAFTA